MKRKILSLAIVGVLVLMLFSLTGCFLTGLGLYMFENDKGEVVRNDDLKEEAKQIYDKSKETATVSEATLSRQEKETFNSRFTQYEGKTISGTKVRALINAIEQNNKSNPEKTIKIKGDVTATKDVRASLTYKVEFSYNTQGLINEVKISKN